jgi:hypothetical protein
MLYGPKTRGFRPLHNIYHSRITLFTYGPSSVKSAKQDMRETRSKCRGGKSRQAARMVLLSSQSYLVVKDHRTRLSILGFKAVGTAPDPQFSSHEDTVSHPHRVTQNRGLTDTSEFRISQGKSNESRFELAKVTSPSRSVIARLRSLLDYSLEAMELIGHP